MAWWAAGLAVLGWVPVIAILGVAPGAAIALGRRAFLYNPDSGRTTASRWLGGFGVAGGALGLGWPAYFIYEAGYCPGNPPPTVGASLLELLAGWLIIVATFIAPAALGYLGTSAALHEKWAPRRRSAVGALLIVGAVVASLWAELAILLIAMAECY
jgi:hypothetical protein